MKKLGIAIRTALTLWLIYGVYTETGIFTTIFAALVWASSEFHTMHLREINKILKLGFLSNLKP